MTNASEITNLHSNAAKIQIYNGYTKENTESRLGIFRGRTLWVVREKGEGKLDSFFVTLHKLLVRVLEFFKFFSFKPEDVEPFVKAVTANMRNTYLADLAANLSTLSEELLKAKDALQNQNSKLDPIPAT